MPLPAALLQGPVFRGLWFAWLAANLTMWMNDVAAAWLMTTLTTSPVMVALVQTASRRCRCSCSACPAARWPTSSTGAATSPPRSCGCRVNALLLAALSLAGQLTARRCCCC
ncbi:MAG: MFS transporter [Comamonadaceae bacterium]|nr:MFS transporter [Comamonadaceae bacterium]